jgi:polysaccharide biosynthesis transport protein
MGSVAVAVTLTAGYASRIQPVFEAEALVLLQVDEASADAPAVLAEDRVREERARQALSEFRSGDMAERLMEDLDLHLMSEFNPARGVDPRTKPTQVASPQILDRIPDPLADALAGPVVGQSHHDQALALRAQIVERVMAGVVAEGTGRPGVVSVKFRARDPQLAALGANVLAELYVVDQRAAMQTVARDMHGFLEREIVRLREAIADAGLLALKHQVAESAPPEVAVTNRHQTARSERTLLEIYGGRLRQIDAHAGSPEPAAKVIAEAVAPETPLGSPSGVTFGITLLGALFAGSLAAFGLERRSNTVRTAAQIEDLLTLPTLASIPAIAGAQRWHKAPDRHVLDYPDSPFGQAVSALAAIVSADGTAQGRTILVTSAVAKEGKTSMSLCLARACGRSEVRTLLIECDLRQPRLHELIGGSNRRGLGDVLLGRATLEDVTRLDDRSGAFLVTAGVTASAQRVASEEMRRILTDASKCYDLVILDGPPVLSGLDAAVLAQLADQTVFLMKWGSTLQQNAVAGVTQLLEAGADVAGVILNQVRAIDADFDA